MITQYVLLKFLHILIAIIALGTSAGLGIVLEFYGNHPTHGPFVLRAIHRLLVFVVIPGYVLMLVTGLWLMHLSWSLTTKWLQGALVLWGIGAVVLPISLAVLRKQIRLLETSGPATDSYKRVSLLERVLGGGVGFVVVAILYLMVAKPGA
jgi:uncharacterized membrane protein